MLRKLIVTKFLLTPLLSFAAPLHCPEINGSNTVLGIALLGGLLSLTRRTDRK